MIYPVRTPWLIKMAYQSCVWDMPSDEGRVYLTFDDGPHEQATPYVLDELGKRQAKATFFSIGNNVERLPSLHQRVLDEGHACGNHTWSHMNGWRVPDNAYLEDIQKATTCIKGNLFRPPYGRISTSQVRSIRRSLRMKVIMWSLLSGDFDIELNQEKCLRQVIDRMRLGDIIVFHDSSKAEKKLKYVLPRVLDEIGQRGWSCDKLT
jgi:hypothetical protein